MLELPYPIKATLIYIADLLSTKDKPIKPNAIKVALAAKNFLDEYLARIKVPDKQPIKRNRK